MHLKYKKDLATTRLVPNAFFPISTLTLGWPSIIKPISPLQKRNRRRVDPIKRGREDVVTNENEKQNKKKKMNRISVVCRESD